MNVDTSLIRENATNGTFTQEGENRGRIRNEVKQFTKEEKNGL
jgi:hypothetical protein